MIEVTATEQIHASAEQVLEAVMDVDRYREADRKIRRVLRAERTGDVSTVTILTVLRGVPAIARQQMVLHPDRGIDVTNVPGWMDHLVEFEGRFACEPGSDPGSTCVTHSYRFRFVAGLDRLADRLLGDWLQRQISEEVVALRELVERNSDGLRS